MSFLERFNAQVTPSRNRRRVAVQSRPFFDQYDRPEFHSQELELVNVEVLQQDLDEMDRQWREYQSMQEFFKRNYEAKYHYEQYRILQELQK